MRGLTVVEIAMLVFVLVVMSAAVLVLLPHPNGDHRGAECMNNVRNLAGLLTVFEQELRTGHPQLGGVNLILWLVAKGEIEGEDNLRSLFCPGDEEESLEKAGGTKAYAGLDLKKPGRYDHLSSYAGRDLLSPKCSVRPGSHKNVVLICEDSEDHHENGFVVGLSNGAVKWRRKVEDWDLDEDAAIVVGPESVVAELRCLRRD